MKWRLYENYFDGRPCKLRCGDAVFDVAADGTFEVAEPPSSPLWSIAAIVGSKRDRSSTRK